MGGAGLSVSFHQQQIDWQVLRERAQSFQAEAFQFVRDGLVHTTQMIHGQEDDSPMELVPQHVSGQQLCLGMRDLAMKRYGMMALTVLHHWGITRTEDFGTIVYAMIDRGELNSCDEDSIEDFRGVYDFAEEFGAAWSN